MPPINREQQKKFAEDGFIVLPQVVPDGLIHAARIAVADRMREDPPPAYHRGPHFHFLFNELPEPLLAPLYKSAAIGLVASLMVPGASLDQPEHVQISL